MDAKDKALVKIATDALRAIQRDCATDSRHYDLWYLAISRIRETQREIESDEEIASIRSAPRRLSMEDASNEPRQRDPPSQF